MMYNVTLFIYATKIKEHINTTSVIYTANTQLTIRSYKL